MKVRYFTTVLKLRYFLTYLFPIATIVGGIFAYYFITMKYHNMIPVGQYSRDLNFINEYNNTISANQRWVVYLRSIGDTLCGQNKTYLQTFTSLLQNAITQMINKTNIVFESYITFSGNSLQKHYCSTDLHSSFIVISVEQVDQLSFAKNLQKIITELQDLLQYYTIGNVVVTVISPGQNANKSFTDIKFQLQLLLFVIPFVIILLCVYCRSHMSLVLIQCLNFIYSLIIANAINFIIYQLFWKDYSSFTNYYLLLYLALQQIFKTLKFSSQFSRAKILATQKLSETQELKFLLAQQAQDELIQGIQIGKPPQETNIYEEQDKINIIKYHSILYALYYIHICTFVQELLVFLLSFVIFVFLFTLTLPQLSEMGFMGMIQCVVCFLVNEYNTLPLIAIFSEHYFKISQFQFKKKFKTYSCYEYISSLKFNRGSILKSLNTSLELSIESNISQKSKEVDDTENSISANDPIIIQTQKAHKINQNLLKESLKISTFYSKIQQNKWLQILIIFLLIIISFGFGLGTLMSTSQILINQTQSQSKFSEVEEFYIAFPGAYMAPFTLAFNLSEHIETDQEITAFQLALKGMILNLNQQTSFDSRLQIKTYLMQCPFLINNQFINVSLMKYYRNVFEQIESGNDTSQIPSQDKEMSVAFNFVSITQMTKNMQEFQCLTFPNISINGELAESFVPILRQQEQYLQDTLSSMKTRYSINMKVIAYDAYLYDVSNTASAFTTVQVIIYVIIMYLITFMFSLAVLGSLLLVIVQQTIYWFGTFILCVFYSILYKETLNPFLFISNSFLAAYFTAETVVQQIIMLCQLKKEQFEYKKSIILTSSEMPCLMFGFLIVILSSAVMLFAKVEILKQIAMLILFDSFIFTVFLIPFGTVAFFTLFGEYSLWPQSCKRKVGGQQCQK